MLLITNGTIVDPVQGIYKGDILIRDGKIAKIADKIEPVSYTHLDVYKRQRISRLFIREVYNRPVKREKPGEIFRD